MTLTQENRLLTITTPLGDNVLLLQGIGGTDGLSVPFSFELDLVSENGNITFEDIIGQNVTVAIVLADGDERFFNGIISRFSQDRGSTETADGQHLAHYSATMVPWLWLLTRTSDSRIFQKLSVPDIVEQIFTEKGFNDYTLKLHDTYEKKEYCVQYRETDFNFVSRLLEQEGICYWFKHEDGKHTMILADSPEEHKACPKQENASCQASVGGLLDEDVITDLDKMKEIRIGKYTVKDFNFEMPTTDLKVEVASTQTLGPGEREIYDYPAEYTIRTQGDRLANLRMQAEEAKITTITGSSNCRAFTSGYRFTLSNHYSDDMNDKSYVLTSVNHGARESVGGTGGGSPYYSNSFTCIPFEIPYRPPLITPKPMIGGVQTAIVVGPSGEEIYTDGTGRIKVQFHWDREGQNDENSSCWIRVSQPSAGGGWGSVYIPRIGHEVIVHFLEGDPDRPIITGCVYNGMNAIPFGSGIMSGAKSNTSPGGGGYNEFSLNDTAGEEKIVVHGQYDMESTIENDQTLTVHNNRTSTIDVDDSESIGSNQTINVGSDQKIDVGNNQTVGVGADQSVSVGANKTLDVGANHTETIGANMSLKVGSNKTETVSIASTESVGAAKALSIGAAYQVSVGAAMNETVGGLKAEEIGAVKSVNVGASSSENVGGSKSVNAGKDISGKAGKNISQSAGQDVSIASGKKMVLSAGDDFGIGGKKKGVIEIKDQLTIKVGKASITLKKNGDIIIDGKNINTEGSGNIVMKAKKILEN